MIRYCLWFSWVCLIELDWLWVVLLSLFVFAWCVRVYCIFSLILLVFVALLFVYLLLFIWMFKFGFVYLLFVWKCCVLLVLICCDLAVCCLWYYVYYFVCCWLFLLLFRFAGLDSFALGLIAAISGLFGLECWFWGWYKT